MKTTPTTGGSEPDWYHLKQYGYAPGGYMGKCHTCEKIMEFVDKRASICRPCAEDQHAMRNATDIPTPGEAAAQAGQTFAQWADGLTQEQRYDFDSEGRGYKKDKGTMMRLAWDAAKSDAQAIIDRLTHELEVACGVGKNLFDCAQELLQEKAAHQAAALPDIEALMVLACEFASAHYLFERFGGQGYGDVRDAARESLRAALARALPVGEERDAAPGTALVSRVETLSEPGAALKVQVLHLTEAGRECLTLNAAASNHLHRLLGWADCEVGQAPDEMVQGVRELAARGLETDEAGKARLLQAHQTASNVPKYIRAAIKSLRAAMAPKGETP